MAKNNNPANAVEGLPKDFKPMTSAVLRLHVPSRDGYHRHWFRGTPERLARAQQAYYRFVDADEIEDFVTNTDLAGDSTAAGSTDLGTRVSVVSGDDVDSSGQPGRLYLMECPMEYYEASKRILEERNESVADALRSGLVGAGHGGETQSDQKNRYLKSKVPDLFNPNKRRL